PRDDNCIGTITAIGTRNGPGTARQAIPSQRRSPPTASQENSMRPRSIMLLTLATAWGRTPSLAQTRNDEPAPASVVEASTPVRTGRGTGDGAAFFERIKRLEGKWTAQTRDGVMTNV